MPRRDPLLAAARALLSLMMALAALLAAALAVAIPLVFVFRERVLATLAHGGAAAPPHALWALVGVMALIILTSLLAIQGQRLLRRVIDSVADGDPFIPNNARRFHAMAWLTAGVQVLLIPLDGLLTWLTAVVGHIRFDSGFSLGGILLTLLLFILARVFRQGAAMREELEGTV